MTQNVLEILDYFQLDESETSTHLRNVKFLTQQFLKQIPNISRRYGKAVVSASLLHDIGKASIPEPILYKKGRLNETERLIVETHPITGLYLFSKILTKFKLLQTPMEQNVVKHVILYHHERWDGTGYPHGLQGQTIPLESRIITIIDVYDALTSVRSYKEAWTKAEAIAYLQSESGKMFDPTLVATFIAMIAEETEVQKNHG